MSEPRTQSERITELPDGAIHWSIHDERIDFRSEAYAVPGVHGWVLIDPLPVTPALRAKLGTIEAICLTGGFHQRAAWSFDAAVWAPVGAEGLEGEPSLYYEPGALLPGALKAMASVGPNNPHALFLWQERALFCGDLVMRDGDGPFRLVPERYRRDPAGLAASVQEISGWDLERLYPAHGAPLLSGAREALAALAG